jgi:hypothetical protein
LSKTFLMSQEEDYHHTIEGPDGTREADDLDE